MTSAEVRPSLSIKKPLNEDQIEIDPKQAA